MTNVSHLIQEYDTQSSFASPPSCSSSPVNSVSQIAPRSSSANGKISQGKLLFVSLLENYCDFLHKNAGCSQQLFFILCSNLLNLGILKEADISDESLQVRSTLKYALKQLIFDNIAKLREDASQGTLSAGSQDCEHLESLKFDSRYSQDFLQLAHLGYGAFGSVYRVKNRLDGREYAIKKIRFNHLKPELLCKIQREVYSLARLDHPNVVRYNSAWIENSGQFHDHQQQTDGEEEALTDAALLASDCGEASQSIAEIADATLCIQMQLCHYTLKDWLDARNELIYSKGSAAQRLSNFADSVTANGCMLNAQENIRIFKQIIKGLAYIHGNNFIHRDLKPQNIFFLREAAQEGGNAKNTIKIGDFSLVASTKACEPGAVTLPSQELMLDLGESRRASGKQAAFSSSAVGTTIYAAPEQLAMSCDQLTANSDIYSVGIIFFELFYPCYSESERCMLIERLRKQHLLPEELLVKHPHEAAFILWCTADDPAKRPSSKDILELKIFETTLDDGCSCDCQRLLAEKEAEIGQLQARLSLLAGK